MSKSPSSTDALRDSEKRVSDSEEELEKQAAEISLRLSLLKAKREKAAKEEKAAAKDKISLSDLNKATDEYLAKTSSGNPTRDPVMSARTPSKKQLDNRLDRIHEAIKINKGSEWIKKKKMSLEAGKSRKGVSDEKETSSPILSTERTPTEKSKDSNVEESSGATAPAESVVEKEVTSLQEDPVEKEATIPQEKISPSPKDTPVCVAAPSVHQESSPSSQAPSSSEVLIKSFAKSVKATPSVPIKPSIPVPVETEVPADPELEKLFAEVDEWIEEEIEQSKKRKKSVVPTRMSKRHITTHSETEEVNIVEPLPKKSKIVKDSSSVKKVQKKSTKAGGAHKEKDEGIVIKGIWFHSEEASSRWELVCGRKIISEGILDLKRWLVPEVVDKLKAAGLLNALKSIKPFSESLIREFAVNIPEEFGNPLNPEYGIVKVRGRSIQVSPVTINSLLKIDAEATKPKIANWHEVAQVLTNGKVTKWTGLTLDSNPLTTSYALLHGMCIKNWMPTSHRSSLSKQMAGLLFHIGQGHKVDLGEIIFDQLANQVRSKTPKHPIGHPSTIQQLILQQAPEILSKSEALIQVKPLLSDWKLFTNDHHIDVSVPKPVQEAIMRKDQGTTKRGKPAKALKAQESLHLTWLKKHLKLLEGACKDTKAQIAALELKEPDSDEDTSQSASDDDN